MSEMLRFFRRLTHGLDSGPSDSFQRAHIFARQGPRVGA